MHGRWRRFSMLLLRDLIAIAAVLALWSVALTMPKPLSVGAIALHLAAGLATAFAGYLLHEWGHLLGAWISGSHFALPATPFESFFLFRFDNLHNSRPQFFCMALGGFASSILSVIVLLLVLPRELLAGQCALVLTALGVLATLLIEVPEFLRVWRGAPIPDGAAFLHPGSSGGASKSQGPIT